MAIEDAGSMWVTDGYTVPAERSKLVSDFRLGVKVTQENGAGGQSFWITLAKPASSRLFHMYVI